MIHCAFKGLYKHWKQTENTQVQISEDLNTEKCSLSTIQK